MCKRLQDARHCRWHGEPREGSRQGPRPQGASLHLTGTLIQSLCRLSSVLYLEGSVLVFEDIFRLIAFYCVSR